MIATFVQEHMAAEKTGGVEGVKANILTELRGALYNLQESKVRGVALTRIPGSYSRPP